MRYRVCTEPGCPNVVTGHNRCAECRRAHEQARGTRQQRGYTAEHDQLRAYWAPRVAAGNVACWRCGLLILGPFDLGHDDHDRTIYRGPEHPLCNRATRAKPLGGIPKG